MHTVASFASRSSSAAARSAERAQGLGEHQAVSSEEGARASGAPPSRLPFNPALHALEKKAGEPARSRGPLTHMRSVLASPTDKLMSPATRGVHDIRRKKVAKDKLKPQALSMLFESMKQK
ncbi:hypothetical protein GGI04_003192 [Coemansia thaxteri]|nr:hypothetical protein GGI04_003192 [Coemansia thaxteri]KAJ2469282.1 hypothetical protein GGI02_003440 [Coemansia sp. RSA 2322]